MEFFKFEIDETLKSDTNIFSCVDKIKMKFKKNNKSCGDVNTPTKPTTKEAQRLAL